MSLKGEYEEYYEDGVVDRSDHHSGTDDDDDIGMGRADNTFSSSANSSSSSSFMTSSSSSGSGESGGTIGIIPRPDPKFNHRRPSVNEEGEEAEERWDCPAYILMDEDGYEEVVEGIRIQGLSMLSNANNGQRSNVSRPASPCRQTRIQSLLSRLDTILSPPTPTSATETVVSSSSRHFRYLAGVLEGPMAGRVGEDERMLLHGLLSTPEQTQSKWAHPGRVGQAELYAALDRVLTDLRTFLPYALPFSSRVSRKDVPDYHDVIKRPMDLGTMGRKLKGFLYGSKREFQADLNRIYSNCFTYNTDPDSPLRLHVTLLRDKWTRLMAEVPDIEIKSISRQADRIIPEESSSPVHSPETMVAQVETTALPVSVPGRSAEGMGMYQRGRLRAGRRAKRKEHASHGGNRHHRQYSQFYPELLLPFQILPDPPTQPITCPHHRPANSTSDDPYPPLLANMALWRRLRCQQQQEGEGEEARTLRVERPKEFSAGLMKQALAVLLGSMGFEAVRSDAMSYLLDTLQSKMISTISSISPSNTSLTDLRKSLGLSAPPSITRLRLHLLHFSSSRRRHLESALGLLSAYRAEQRELDQRLAMAEVDVVSTTTELEDNNGDEQDEEVDDDLIMMDEEDDLDIFGLKATSIIPSHQSQHHISSSYDMLLALPKRSFASGGPSASGLEGSLDPLRFAGEPPIKRLDED